MSKGVKVLLVVFAVCLLGMVAVGVGGYLWFDAKKDDLRAGGAAAEAAGAAFGARADQAACLQEGLRRAESCGGFGPICEAENGIFLRACLGRATPTPDFCAGVPAEGQILESAVWANAECLERGDAAGTSRCARLMQRKQDFCVAAR
jgi:hypothetical protein